jgi:hypothetical protein
MRSFTRLSTARHGGLYAQVTGLGDTNKIIALIIVTTLLFDAVLVALLVE